MDNLNTYRFSCLYEAFTPAESRRLIEKTEVVHTPKHGSWLRMAECELSVLEKRVLTERVEREAALRERIDVWNADRNSRPMASTGGSRPAMPESSYDAYTRRVRHVETPGV
jgi:hypothetical protein